MNEPFRIWSKNKQKFVSLDFYLDKFFDSPENERDFIINEFIGVSDRNNNKIYEEDIVETDTGNRFVVGFKDYFQQVDSNKPNIHCFYFQDINCGFQHGQRRFFGGIREGNNKFLFTRVIGNVSENQELLK